MQQPFYRAFEDRYRGSRQLIRGRLEAYSPFIGPFLASWPDNKKGERPSAVDLGCGRGEWMELLRDRGFDAHGVDFDEGMLAGCREIGLDVVKGDALKYLQELPDDSQCVVSAFHVVEHIPFSSLERLVRESLRVLQPGGLLILETPNPENLMVGTERFHLDPTHSQPIPHLLLSFLLEHHGFSRVKVLPLQEPEGIREKTEPGLQDLLDGVSPDYGAVGQKAAAPEILSPWDAAFSGAYGQGLLNLARRFDESHARRAGEVNGRLDTVTQEVAVLSKALQEASQQNEELRQRDMLPAMQQKLDSLSQEIALLSRGLQEMRRQRDETRQPHAHHQLATAQEEARQLKEYVQAMHVSTSWRLTAPVRWLSRQLGYRGRKARSAAAEDVPAAPAEPGPPDGDLPNTPLSPTGLQVYRSLQSTRKKSPHP